MLIADKMLGTSNHSSILDALDRLGHADAGKDGVWGKPLPVSAGGRHTAEGAGDRPKKDVDPLALGLLAHGIATSVDQRPVKGGSSGLARRESRVEVRPTNTEGGVV